MYKIPKIIPTTNKAIFESTLEMLDIDGTIANQHHILVENLAGINAQLIVYKKDYKLFNIKGEITKDNDKMGLLNILKDYKESIKDIQSKLLQMFPEDGFIIFDIVFAGGSINKKFKYSEDINIYVSDISTKKRFFSRASSEHLLMLLQNINEEFVFGDYKIFTMLPHISVKFGDNQANIFTKNLESSFTEELLFNHSLLNKDVPIYEILITPANVNYIQNGHKYYFKR